MIVKLNLQTLQTLKKEEVDLSRLIRVFVTNRELNRKSVKSITVTIITIIEQSLWWLQFIRRAYVVKSCIAKYRPGPRYV